MAQSSVLALAVVCALAVPACSSSNTAGASDAGSAAPASDAGTVVPPSGGDGLVEAGAPSKLTTGADYTLVYSAEGDIGIEARPSVTATFDGHGHFVGYAASDKEMLAIGSADDESATGDDYAAWGVWQGGPTTGTWYFTEPAGDFTFGPGMGFHYAIGKQTLATALPSGTATYTIVGGSPPTIVATEALGELKSATATCDFGAQSCTFDLVATVASNTGTAKIAGETGKINAGTTQFAQVRTTSIVAMFVGGGAERIALVWSSSVGGGTARGSAVLKK